jgi:uncharacterized RDD family membrane protein YckC
MQPLQPPSSQPPAPQPTATPPPAGWHPQSEEGPAPGVRFANHGGRLIAYIVDGIIQFVIFAVITFVLAVIGFGAAANDATALAGVAFIVWLVVAFLVSIVYFPYFWASGGGSTPGMRLFHLRVVRDHDGGRVSWPIAIVRWVGFIIDNIVFGLPIGLLWILIDKRRRAWHDLIAGTVVIES